MTLKELLSPELFAQVQARIDEVNAGQTDKVKHIRFADLSEGGYVSVDKFNAQVNTLTQQVTDLQGQITQRDTDMGDLKTKLTAAQADAGKLAEVQTALTGLQSKYDTDKQTYEQKLTKQGYEFAIREKANNLKFSSGAAKKAFIQEALGKEFKRDGDSLLGYDEFVTKYKADDPGAFVADAPGNPPPADPQKPPAIVLPSNQPPAPTDKALFGFNFNGVRAKPAEGK